MANVFDKLTGAEHIVAESSLLHATYGGGMIKDLVMDKARDNGTCVGRSAVTSTYKGVQAFTAKAAVAGEPVYLLITSPLGYNSDRKYYRDEKYFYNDKDEVARGYELKAEDIFTVSSNAVTPLASTGAVVGNYVYFDETTGKYIEASAAPASGVCIAQIIEVVNHYNWGSGTTTAYRFIVVNPSKASAPVASATTLGGVKIGSGVTVTSDGTISVGE